MKIDTKIINGYFVAMLGDLKLVNLSTSVKEFSINAGPTEIANFMYNNDMELAEMKKHMLQARTAWTEWKNTREDKITDIKCLIDLVNDY